MAISKSIFGSSTLKFNDVVGAILNEEMRQKIFGETSGNYLTTNTKRRKMERGRGQENHSKLIKGVSKSI